jgi:putative transposase
MYLTETHNIKRNHPLYQEVDSLCFDSKNLYNKALYLVRQEFIGSSLSGETANYINYNTVNRIMINTNDVDYRKLPAKVSNLTLMKLDKNWLSFFKSIKDWGKNKHKYKGKPSLPKYLPKKQGRYLVEYELGAISKTKLKDGIIKLSKTNIEIPFINKDKGQLKYVRLVPGPNDMHKIEIIYDVEEKDLKLNQENILTIDLGVSNLCTLTSNKEGFTPLIINGCIIKSINQHYNKYKGLMQSELPKGVYSSKKIKKLTLKRENQLKYELHNISSFLMKLCIKNNIGRIVVGKNEHWKTECNLGDKTNQNFVGIPYNNLLMMLDYKSKLIGNSYGIVDESYSSKASFLDLDDVPNYVKGSDVEHKFSGKRIKRGLYKSADGRVINADVNGSYNILRKVMFKEGKDFTFGEIEGLAVNPVRIKSTKDFHRFLC